MSNVIQFPDTTVHSVEPVFDDITQSGHGLNFSKFNFEKIFGAVVAAQSAETEPNTSLAIRSTRDCYPKVFWWSIDILW